MTAISDARDALELFIPIVAFVAWLIRLESKIMFAEKEAKRIEKEIETIGSAVLTEIKEMREENRKENLEMKLNIRESMVRIEHINKRTIKLKADDLIEEFERKGL